MELTADNQPDLAGLSRAVEGPGRQGGSDPALQGLLHPFLPLGGRRSGRCAPLIAGQPTRTPPSWWTTATASLWRPGSPEAGADLVVGSLIKNPGGGLAPTGGYIAGRRDSEAAAMRLTAPGSERNAAPLWATTAASTRGFSLRPHHRPGGEDRRLRGEDNGAAGVSNRARLGCSAARHHPDAPFRKP